MIILTQVIKRLFFVTSNTFSCFPLQESVNHSDSKNMRMSVCSDLTEFWLFLTQTVASAL